MVIATQKGAVRALDGRKEERPQFATVFLRRWAATTPPRPMYGATPPSHRTSLALWRLVLVRDVPFGGAAMFLFFVRR